MVAKEKISTSGGNPNACFVIQPSPTDSEDQDTDKARFKTAAAVTMEATFWNVTPCTLAGINKCFGGTCCHHLQGTQNVEAVRSSETSVNFSTVGRHILADGNFHIQR